MRKKIKNPDMLPAGLEPAYIESEPVLKGWTIYYGDTVYLLTQLDRIEEPIKERDALKPGTQIAVPWFGGHFINMVVKRDGYAEEPGGEWGSYLEFGADDRQCWVSTGLTNAPGAIKRLTRV